MKKSDFIVATIFDATFLIEMKKAFDKICHPLLLNKFKYDFGGVVLRWFCSGFSDSVISNIVVSN